MRRSETSGYLEGLAHVTMINLRDKFSKTDALSAEELRQDLAKLKWKEVADSAYLFDGLIKVDIFSTNLDNNHITESEICYRLFIADPKKYLPILQGVRKKHKENLTLGHIEEEIKETYHLEHL